MSESNRVLKVSNKINIINNYNYLNIKKITMGKTIINIKDDTAFFKKKNYDDKINIKYGNSHLSKSCKTIRRKILIPLAKKVEREICIN